jgi:heme/copper-type cytochrome/quinol oxidase subunit 2
VKRIRISNPVLVALLLAVGGSLGMLSAGLHRAPPQERIITITARKYGYDPAVLKVNRGDRLRIRLVAKDVTHGFYLEGYDVDAKARPENPTFWLRRPSKGEEYQEVEEISVVANHAGKFHYRCSITCGYMHPFMQGELIVSPNYLFPTSLGLSAALALAMMVVFRRAPAGEPS